jgi:hypothetical protein
VQAKRTAVIGAGSSGLTVVKALLAAELAVVCFERGSRVGGNWQFDNDNGQSRIYRSLCINTSRERMQFSDFPMPRSCPDYARHDQVAAYFEGYADRFGLRSAIRFRTRVERVRPLPFGGYDVSTDTGSNERFEAVVVANGHHWDPSRPELPGKLVGPVLHSHDYIDPDEPHALRGRRVVVVGFGNSAVDIACELARAGCKVALSVRRGAWVLPKYVFGKPIDQPGILPSVLPQSLRTSIAESWYRWSFGKLGAYGLPEPDHRLGHAHPTLSEELLPLLRSGAIGARPELVALCGSEVEYRGGQRERADAVVLCTGYKVSFPFFEPSFVSAPDNELPLFLRCFHLEHPNLMFAGLAQPLGAIMPLVEAQGRLFAQYLLGRYRLPERAEMRARAEAERERVRRRFVASPRHTMQLDFDEYLRELDEEIERGHQREKSARALSADRT